MSNFVIKLKNLPNGVRGIIYKYLQHDNARIIKEAIKNNKMKLKYLKSHTIKHANFRSKRSSVLVATQSPVVARRASRQILSGNERHGAPVPGGRGARIDREFLQDNNYNYNVHIITLALLELRPSNLKQKTYGEGAIERTNLSIGEIIRLRRLGLL